jgi:hypothetical protein
MQSALTASCDARQPTTFRRKHDVNLRPGSDREIQSQSNLQRRQALLRMTKTLGLGACLTIAVGAAAPHSASAAETRVGIPAILDAGQNAIRVPHTQPQRPFSTAADNIRSTDPLEGIVPVAAADMANAELQKQIILTIPLTNPPTSQGSEDEEPISRELTDYMDFEEMRVPVWIVDTILRASRLTEADPVYMMALADKESSFLPGNKASTSSAVGLFQFISSTWLEAVRSFGPKHGLIAEAQAIEGPTGKLNVANETMREHILSLRRNPYLSALMAAELMKRDKAKIENRLGRKLSRSEFYLSHFFGVDSASRFIALVDDTPKKSAPSAFPAAAKSNKSLFFAKDGKKTRQLSVAEVYGKIDDMIDKRLNRYEDVSMRATADASF